MSRSGLRLFRRSIGQDIRAWPMLALLAVIALLAIGCVLWFMREAMRNERIAVREKLVDAYRGQLALLRVAALERWAGWLRQLDSPSPAAAHFAAAVQQGLAESIVCFGENGAIVYPRGAHPPPAAVATRAAALQKELRELAKAGRSDDLVRVVEETFANGEAAGLLDAEGRLVAANAELMALELIADGEDPRFQRLADRLASRALDYDGIAIPSAQRRFIMRELMRLQPTRSFPTLAAEDLAARYLESDSRRLGEGTLATTPLPGIWSVRTPSGRVLALVEGGPLIARITAPPVDGTWPKGVTVVALPPGSESATEPVLATLPLGEELPGWRLTLSVADHRLFEMAAERRIGRYLAIGSITAAALALLALIIGHGLGQQVRLARLKNDLVATVSHELKTPLTAIRALVDTLLDSDEFDEKTTRDYLRLIAQENTRLSRLIENFLTFSRLARNRFAFAFARVRPEEIGRAAVAALIDRVQAPGCALTAEFEEDLPEVEADADALTTALLNLLDNAWKYSGQEKRITLRTAAVNGHVHFAVGDNGVGLAPSEMRRIFAQFYQVDQRLSRTGSGCGLGLSIVQSIVEAHNGAISVESEMGRGSTFTIKLPALIQAPS